MKRAILFSLFIILILIFSGCSGQSDSISSASDLVGRNIGVLSGSAAEHLCSSIENARIVPFATSTDASIALKNGDIDAIVTDRTIAKKIVNATSGIRMLSDPAFVKENYVIAVKKGNYDMLGLINVVLAEADSDGKLSDIADGYVGKTQSQRSEFYLTQSQLYNSGDFTGGTLKVGVSLDLAPYVFTYGEDIMGIDIEISRLIAKKVSKQLLFIVLDDSELVSALRRGDVDFIISDLIADERYASQIDYSDSYYSSAQSIIVVN